jgi:hypothetical protein
MRHKFRYDPRWQAVIMAWGFAAGSTASALLGWGPKSLEIGVSVVFAIFAGLGTVRRYCFSRTLELDEEGMWLPSGVLRLKMRRVVFADVTDAWEAFLPRVVVLCLRYHGRTLEVSSILLPDHETYLAVAGYIYARVKHGE